MRFTQDKLHTSRGSILVLLGTMMLFIMGLAGLAVDMIHAYSVRAKLVTAVDAAALGGARALNSAVGSGAQQAAVTDTVQKLFNANFPAGFLLTRSRTVDSPTITDNGNGSRTVRVVGRAVMPTFFIRAFGYESLNVGSTASAMRRDVNLMLVLDRSGSMNRAPGFNPGPTAFDDLRVAATEFVSYFDDLRDRLGVVSFGTSPHLDVAPATGFKTTVTSEINRMIANNSGTTSPEGLWMAYTALKGLGGGGALNVIVFFTDGVATGFAGNFNVTSGTCAGQQRAGVAQTFSVPGSDQARGLHPLDAGPAPIANDETVYLPGCGFSSSSDLRNRVPIIPALDLHGTSVYGYRSIPYISGGNISMRGLNIKPVSDNLTINTAARARQDAGLPITIYSIGVGGAEYPADHELMRMVANDPLAATYSSSEATGIYVYAPDASQLKRGFRRVASEIHRLVQ